VRLCRKMSQIDASVRLACARVLSPELPARVPY
jgi:hypothetical protein